ncbi:uncharacterized protein BJ171DRAFT_500622 [Polychytrium aggregatum]|uniref:uncharacterized protein n=1 Tax=Polychytrium aggregatum TaxID=110093 RepID=UPI0022FEA060|nr:uncharacterized protein BJ171DRAFT_500622 [Polychytrium aggregatum]KAI9205492.1 hypothetical protein BJ171DRAFT_500622 [Polychytrium aggregatum]
MSQPASNTGASPSEADPFLRPHQIYNENASVEELEQIYYRFQSLKQKTLLELGTATKNAADFFELCVDRHQDALAVMAVDHEARYTFRQLDEAANRIAWWGRHECGLQQLDVVALLMENRPEFLAFTMGLAKIGVTIALINTNLKGALLLHAIRTAKAKCAVVSMGKLGNWSSLGNLGSLGGSEKSGDDEQAQPLPPVWIYQGEGQTIPSSELDRLKHEHGWARWHALQPELLARQSAERPKAQEHRNQVHERTPHYYIFTSGTTGPSKAAKFSHRRFVGCAVTWAGPSGLRKGDRYYITLPLYHGNGGCVAVAPCYLLGNPIVLREKFSASNFFKDIREHQCVATVYIGELWRYLYLQPPSAIDGTPEFSPLRVAIGNGLRRELWTDITQRFYIRQVVEHYGSTEMPGDAVLNFFNHPGSCGFLPESVAREKSMTGEGGILVQYDVEEDRVVRDEATQHCVPCEPNQVGEMIMRLPGGLYDGYVGHVATRRKLYENVFEKGDCWWSSGDLLKVDEKGFFFFVDRAGDSYRWKGENVSTNEVQAVVAAFPGIAECNVYGIQIPNTEGRAGMASIHLTGPGGAETFDFGGFARHLSESLPSYAHPVFLRFRESENEKTSTLKFQKFKYSQEGFDFRKFAGPGQDRVYMLETARRSFIPVDNAVLERIEQGGHYRF